MSVPLLIVSGQLGAGKSTLLNFVLSQPHGLKIAVILNEFGASGDIEAKAVTRNTPDGSVTEIVSLQNGCLCCSAQDEGRQALEQLVRDKSGAFDFVLLETSGVADPAEIARGLFHTEDELSSIALDGIVTVVDALHLPSQLAEPDDTVVRQIAVADLLVITKEDLTEDAVEETLRGLNPTATILHARHGQVDLSKILHLNAYAGKPLSFDKETSGHLRNMSTIAIPMPALASLDRFDEILRGCLWGESNLTRGEILRAKGYVRTTDGRAYSIQGVRDVYDITEVPPEPGPTKLVLIGRGLSDDLAARFLGAMSCIL